MDRYELINEFLIERAIEVIESEEDKTDDIDKKVSEITEKIDDLKKTYRSLSHAIDRKDLSEAKELYKKAEKEIDDIDDMLDDLPDNASDSKSKASARRIAKAIFSISSITAFSGMMVAGTSVKDKTITAGLTAAVAGLAGMLGSSYALALNQSFKQKMRATLGKYQLCMQFNIDAINSMEDDEMEKRIKLNTKNININKNTTNTNDNTFRFKESTDVKLSIYEAYEAGYISESEKYELLNMI